MQKERRTIAAFLSGSGEQIEVQIDNVHITNLQTSPYSADIYLTKIFYSSPQQESRREKWIIRVNFTIDPKSVRNELVPYNPLGLSIPKRRIMPRIQPQDKTPFDTVQFRMRKDIVAKLYAYAKFLNDSSPSYVVSAALKEVFEGDKEYQKWISERPEMLDAALNIPSRRGRPKAA
jgi:hypothetical protein